MARRAGEVRDNLRSCWPRRTAAYVYFVETRGRGVFLRAAPIDVSAIVQEQLLDRMRATVLTSATLAVAGSFDYARAAGSASTTRRSCACRPSSTSRAQSLLYLPRRMPPPKSPDFADAVGARRSLEILGRTEGRAFVLFTSYAMMHAVYEIVDGGAARIRCSCKARRRAARCSTSSGPRPHAVLLATSSFWQGVDVVGEQLSCVIIDKLPFASPGDPDYRGADRGHHRRTAATRSTTTRCRSRSSRCSRGWAG